MLNYITKKLENGVKCYIVPKKGYAEKKAIQSLFTMAKL